MKTPKVIKVTQKQLDRLLNDALGNAVDRASSCPSDDLLERYSMNQVTSKEWRLIDDHKIVCPECEHIIEISKEWQTDKGKRQLAELRAKLRGELLEEPPASAKVVAIDERRGASKKAPIATIIDAAAACSGGQWATRETVDHRLKWAWTEDSHGEFHIRFTSTDLALKDAVVPFAVPLSSGEWKGQVVLDKTLGNEVFGDLSVSKDERRQWPTGYVLDIYEPIPQNPQKPIR